MFWQIVLILVLMIPILAIILDSQVGRAIAARLEGKNLNVPQDGQGTRIGYLEGEVERLSEELERLQDESQFLHKLLVERSSAGEALSPGESED